MISDIELLKLLNNKPEVGLKIMMDNYMTLIYTMISNKLFGMYSKEDIEECVSDVFFEVFNYRNRIDSQNSFIKVFLAVIAKRKIVDMHERNKNNNQSPMDDVSVHLHSIADDVDVVRSILLKESNSQLIDATKSLCEPNSKILIRKYHLNQSLKDISKNTGLKVSAYA